MVILGNQRYLSIQRPDYALEKDVPFRLLIQDFAAKKFNQPASLPLPIDEQKAAEGHGDRWWVSVRDLSQLSNGQYACLVDGYKTEYFAVILFDRTPGGENEFRVAGIINPHRETCSWFSSDNSGNSGDMQRLGYVGLPNGNILTYHLSSLDFQFWHGTT